MDIFLFENIGQKIKGVAKVFTVIGFAFSVLGGVLMLITGLFEDELGMYILLAPIAAAVGCLISWLSCITLYGFGELIEVATENERNTRAILTLLKTRGSVPKTSASAAVGDEAAETVLKEVPVVHSWRCDGCGNMRGQTPCEHCGRE